jgi:hypothetical protein
MVFAEVVAMCAIGGGVGPTLATLAGFGVADWRIFRSR